MSRFVVLAVAFGSSLLCSNASGGSSDVIAAFIGNQSSSDRSLVVYTDASPGGITALGNVDGSPRDLRISPDGRRLAFLRRVTGTDQIFVVNLDGSGLRQVTSWNDQFPQLFGWKNNETLLYRKAPGPSQGDVRALDVDSGTDELVLSSSAVPGSQASIDRGAISPDRTSLAFSAQAGSNSPTLDIYNLDLNSGSVSVIADDGGSDNIADQAPIWIGNSRIGWSRAENAGVPNDFDAVSKRVDGLGFSTTAVAFSVDQVALYNSPTGDVIMFRDLDDDNSLRLFDQSSGELITLTNPDEFVATADWVIVEDDTCEGDIDGDAEVDIDDLLRLLGNFGSSCLQH